MSSVFFFQAEDGIRDHCVTGVQTCALPISSGSTEASRKAIVIARAGFTPEGSGRSEERRVGKECRSGWPGCAGAETADIVRSGIGGSEVRTSEARGDTDRMESMPVAAHGAT